MISLTLSTAPDLITANFAPIQQNERHIPEHQDKIAPRFHRQLNLSSTPFNKTSIGDFMTCAIILNNNLFGGRPEAAENLQRDFIPAMSPGRSSRLKSDYLQIHQEAGTE